MTAICEESATINIEQEIMNHPAWYGEVAGLTAEKSLRGNNPYVYLLRNGEYPSHYYVSFVLPDLSIRHQPFVITIHAGEWYCENGGVTGPYTYESINDMIHMVMHCKQEECTPLVRFDIR